MTEYSRIAIPVAGGAIAAGKWGTGAVVAVASHGITANHLSWQRVGELVDELSGGAASLVAVDHRGRAGSAATPGPFGMIQHGADLIAVLDHLGLEAATLVGHSMGGFVVANAAEQHPGRARSLVLVDGGVPFGVALPDGVAGDDLDDAAIESIVQSVIGPALDRLDQRWPDVASYVDFFRRHPAFGPPNEWSAAVEAYVTYDAVQADDGAIRSSVSKSAVLVDGGAAIVDPLSASAIERVTTPTHLLWAPRGVLDQTPGLYAEETIEGAARDLGHLTTARVADTNHYTIVVSEHGARMIAEAVLGQSNE